MARKKPQPVKPSEVFVRRIKEVRERRRWTQRDMCARLAEAGYDTDPATLARTETGKRGITLDDAMAYSAVLGPSFVHMVLPTDTDTPVCFAPNFIVGPRRARQWMRGQGPLRDDLEDARVYMTEISDDEWARYKRPSVEAFVQGASRLADRVDAGDIEGAQATLKELDSMLTTIGIQFGMVEEVGE